MEDGSGTDQGSGLASQSESEHQTESEDEEERSVERRVMIKVVPRERFERRDLLQSHSVSCSFSGNYHYLCCQADECGQDLRDAKQYHRRHKVCERHAKAAVVLVKGLRQRFCQQCSKFHEISEFDGTKRSCRDRLAGHKERRRKRPADQQAEHVQDATLSRMMVTRHPTQSEVLTIQRNLNKKHL